MPSTGITESAADAQIALRLCQKTPLKLPSPMTLISTVVYCATILETVWNLYCST